jgi:hypothetical protein
MNMNSETNVISRRALPSDPRFLFELIDRGTNFSLLRFADGERSLIEGREIPKNTQAFRVDNWSSPSGVSKLGSDLRSSLKFYHPRLIHAISCPCCSISDFAFFAQYGDPRVPVTHSNVFINAYYTDFLRYFEAFKRPINLVLNFAADVYRLPFQVKQLCFVPTDCVNYWELKSSELLQNSRSMARGALDELFLIAAGPMSEPLIVEMIKENENNCYVDVGSALDEFFFGRKTRPYMQPGHPLAKLRCSISKDLR